MSETKFTPGPWRQNPAAKHEIIADSESLVICRTPSASGLIMKAAPYNGTLIAAAPDLYAALNALVAAEDQFIADVDITVDDLITDAVKAARAALAKARGEP